MRPDHPLTAPRDGQPHLALAFRPGHRADAGQFRPAGRAPGNPPLLDWLALRFVEGDWSIKALHRLIMLSSTYQMSARRDARTAELRPGKSPALAARTCGGWRPRRSATPCWRSAARSTGRVGGSLLHVKNREYLFDHTSKDTTRYDSRRRSLYLPVIRNNVYDVFQLFDFPDPAVPNGDRATTTVAPQALFLMNSDWVAQLCERLAERLLNEQALDDAVRVRLLYRKAYGREATAEETGRDSALVREMNAALSPAEPDAARCRLRAWSGLCQVVMSANEFVYVR